MKIAIHHSPGSFSDDWIDYCVREGIEHKLVDCYESDIVTKVKDCDALMWHHEQNNGTERLFSKELLFALDHVGISVFPDARTFWHFDDKVAQKYLLEAAGAPLVPSYVFFRKADALQWVEGTDFPKVFKLRGGAGSSSVYLIRSRAHARNVVSRMFGKGISPFDPLRNLGEQLRRYRAGLSGPSAIFRGLFRCIVLPEHARTNPREKGYVYFQDFIPHNDSDTRVIVIDRKAFAIRRMVRKGDFRASGSGHILYERELFDLNTVQLAMSLAAKLKLQCAAFDFVYDATGTPLITEVSYGYVKRVYQKCVGYWDESLTFHDGPFNSLHWMVDQLVKSVSSDKSLR